MKTIFILSVSSDIGAFLARHYLGQGYRVIGTYRSKSSLKNLSGLSNLELLPCDVSKVNSIDVLIRSLKIKKIKWDVFISCVGEPRPVMGFFDSKFDEWQASVNVNSLAQLRVLHGIYSLANKTASVIFMAGGGMNNAVKNFSAYTISKIMLTKMCEFLDLENLNLRIAIIGPGWTKTKIHQTILSDKRTCDIKVKETKTFLKEKQGTPLSDIAGCIDWILGLPKTIVSGRNFSVIYDSWQGKGRKKLEQALAKDYNMYKLRREGNNFNVEKK